MASAAAPVRPALLAEGLGTAALTLASLAPWAWGLPFPAAVLVGATVAGLVGALGLRSGAHLNPAVTVGLAAAGRFPWRRVLPYVAVQVAGAAAAALAVRAAAGAPPLPAVAVPASVAFLVEAALAATLVTVILAVAGRRPAWLAPVAIGATVGAAIAVAGGLTGAPINPARAMGPWLAGGSGFSGALHVAAPLAGGLVAAAIDRAEGVLPKRGKPAGAKPRVLFVCVGNAARSQMAEAFARREGLEADSAGTEPAAMVSSRAVAAMAERGIDISGAAPKALDWSTLASYDRVVTMGCGVAESCPSLRTDEDWGLDDPVHADLEGVRKVRDEVERRVAELARQLGGRRSRQ